MIKFIGFSHVQGTSKKTGNDYDLYNLTFVTDVDSSFKGLSAFSEMVAAENLTAVTGFDVKALATKLDMVCTLDYIKSGNYTKLAKINF